MPQPLRPARSVIVFLLLAGVLGACQTAPQTARLNDSPPPYLAPSTNIPGVPFFPQERYHCGPAALATVLNATGIETTPQQLVGQVYVPGRQGSFQLEIMAAARTHGRLVYELAPSLEDLLAEVNAGNPVLVLQNLGLDSYPQWHFAVVKGYDLPRRRLILNSGLIEDYDLRLAVFERTWARADHWAMTVTGAHELPVTAEPDGVFRSLAALEHSYPEFDVLQAAYESALEQWPKHRDLLMGLGNLLMSHDRLQQAANAYQRVLALYPNYAPAHNNLANVYLESGDLDQARAHARVAVTQGESQGESPGDRFADLYTQTLRDIDAAVDYGTPTDHGTPTTHSSRNSLDWAGIYTGTMPCADCEGIVTTITLNADGSFHRSLSYLGRGEEEFKDNGRFQWDSSGSVVTLESNGGRSQSYQVGENQLFHLDQDGNRITGALADQYVLSRLH